MIALFSLFIILLAIPSHGRAAINQVHSIYMPRKLSYNPNTVSKATISESVAAGSNQMKSDATFVPLTASYINCTSGATPGVSSIAYSPQGNFVALGLSNGFTDVYSVNTTTGAFTSFLGSVSGGGIVDIYAVAFGISDNSFAMAGNFNGDIYVTNIFVQQAQLNSATIDVYGRISAYGYGAQA
jgi:WD40 repeat protein